MPASSEAARPFAMKLPMATAPLVKRVNTMYVLLRVLPGFCRSDNDPIFLAFPMELMGGVQLYINETAASRGFSMTCEVKSMTTAPYTGMKEVIPTFTYTGVACVNGSNGSRNNVVMVVMALESML